MTRRRCKTLPLAIAAFAATVSAARPALADGWSYRAGDDGPSAGFVAGRAFAGLWFSCSGGQTRVSVATGGSRLQAGVDQTVAVTVDGVAFLQFLRFADEGQPALRGAMPIEKARPLIDALAKGRSAEVSTPAGRFALPLKGSGKALAAFGAACR